MHAKRMADNFLLALPWLLFTACEVAPTDRQNRDGGAVADAVDTLAGYAADTLGWFKEGRPVEVDGRFWRPVGEPIDIQRDRLQPAAEFEGMQLYVAKEEAPLPRHLLFLLDDGRWQALEPDSSPRPPD